MQSQNRNQNASVPKFVDKERLAEAVKLMNDGSSVDFASCIQIQGNKLALNSISVATLGTIQVPVPLLDIKRLKQISKISPYGKGCNGLIDPSIRHALEIDANVLSVTSENLNLHLSSLAARHLCFPPGMMTVEARLSRLVLYETGGHFKRILESESFFGTFGMATLQVPVEGGHEGGRYKVQYQGREKLFENHEKSDQNFHLFTYYNNCQVSMEPATRGWKLTLVFDLVWTNAKTLTPPNDLPVFLTSLKEIKAALSPWIPQENDISDNVESHVTHDSNGVVTQPNSSSSVTVDKYASVNSEEDSDEMDDESDQEDSDKTDESDQEDSDDQSDQEDSDETDVQSDGNSISLTTVRGDSRENNVLFFVLQEKYEEKDLLFRRLRGKDRSLAYLLQSCPFLEVHLAMVVLKKTKQGGDEYGAVTCRDPYGNCEFCHGGLMVNRSVKISRWVDSDDCTGNLSITINWKEQCVGPIGNLLTSHGIKCDLEEDDYLDCGGKLFFKYYYNAVLVIRPKHQTTFIYCENNIHSLLDRMENSLISAPPTKKKKIQQKVTSDLQQFITLYCNTRPKGGKKTNSCELTVRLLRLCIALRSRDGLVLLNMLGSHGEGIQNAEVAHAIAQFECKVTGWPDCAHLVQRLVELVPERLTQQLVPIVKLAQYLMEVDCIEGAKMVENFISSSLSNAIEPLAQNLAKMKTENMCQLFIKVHKASSGCLETYPFYNGIIRHFCQILSWRMKEIETIKRETILKVLKRFVLFGDNSLIHSLLKNMCSAKENEKHVKHNLLQDIVSLSTIWRKLDSEIKLVILNTCITLVEAGIASVCPSSTNPTIHQSNNQVLTSKLLNCAKLFILAEKLRFAPEQKNASLAFQQLFTKLAPIHLLELILEIHLSESKASPSIQNFPICLEWYRNLSRSLLSKKFLSIVKSLPDYLAKYPFHLHSSDAFKITHCLLWLNDELSWELFAHQIIKSFPSEKCSNFLRVFINDPKCQEDLKDSSLAFASFTRMIDDMFERSKSLKEPTGFTWEQPTAVVPKFHRGMDEVETFLRSTREKMNLANFVNIHEARSFASKLQKMGKSNGFTVEVTVSGSGRSACCEISKNRRYYDNVVKKFETMKSELAELIDLRRTLKDHLKGKRSRLELEIAASNSGHSSSPAKRVKCDEPLVDISD